MARQITVQDIRKAREVDGLVSAHIVLVSSRERYAEPMGENHIHSAMMDCKCAIAREWNRLQG